jgi:hypothetical protein
VRSAGTWAQVKLADIAPPHDRCQVGIYDLPFLRFVNILLKKHSQLSVLSVPILRNPYYLVWTISLVKYILVVQSLSGADCMERMQELEASLYIHIWSGFFSSPLVRQISIFYQVTENSFQRDDGFDKLSSEIREK